MSDWTWLLIVDAALLAGAALTLVGFVLRDLEREKRSPPGPGEPREGPG